MVYIDKNRIYLLVLFFFVFDVIRGYVWKKVMKFEFVWWKKNKDSGKFESCGMEDWIRMYVFDRLNWNEFNFL